MNTLADKIGNNIRHLRVLNNLTLQALADDLDIGKQRLASYEQGRAFPPPDMLVKFSNFFHIATDALLRADLTKADLNGIMNLDDNRLLFPIIRDDKGNEQIEVINVKASAGYLNGYSDPEFIGRLQKINLPFIPTGKNRAFLIKGDSMPPLRDGSFVVGKYVESLSGIKDGQTYILLTKSEGIVYKRIQKNPKKKYSLTLVSDNKAYQPYEVKAEDIFEIWEYVCSLNIGSYKPEELNIDSIMSMLLELKVEMASNKNSK